MTTATATRVRTCGYACDHQIDPDQPPALRTISYGGGVQSTALLVLAVQRVIDFNEFLFANVGDDTEEQGTLDYVREVAMPYAAEHGIALRELSKTRKDGTVETLFDKLTRPGSRSLSIPYRSKADGPPMSRSCTAEFKVRVLGRWLRAHGASKDNPATVGVGISLDEIQRASGKKRTDYENVVYPLIGIGEDTGLKMRRQDCIALIRDAGLPVPPKSSCWFCPHHTLSAWADQRREQPEVFERSCQLEEHLDARSRANGTGPVFLSRAGIPLREAVDAGQDTLWAPGADGCDDGYCWT